MIMISKKDYDDIYQKGYEDGKNDNITKIEYVLKPSFTTRKLKEQQNEIKRLNNIIDDLKQKNNLAENILYDYLYNDDKITKEKYEQFKGLKEGKQ